MSNIHPTAIVDKKAKLADSVTIGPYSCIGPEVTLGENCRVSSHVNITGRTRIGANCRIFASASIGTIPQDLKFKGEDTELIIGDNTIIREFVTVNKGTTATGRTEVGSGVLLMAYSHIAHDCRVGNGVIIANVGTLGGHVVLEDKVIIGGLVGIHQFVRIGRLSIIGACSKLAKDIVPFSRMQGNPVRRLGLNLIGLRRAGFSAEKISVIEQAYRILFRSGLNVKNVLKRMETELGSHDEVKEIINFITSSPRGIAIR